MVYSVTVEMSRYLDGWRDNVVVSDGSNTSLPLVTLLGGDANDDDTINILDLSFMGNLFGLSCGDPGFNPQADINDDCAINILDVSLAGNNFGQSSPVPWP